MKSPDQELDGALRSLVREHEGPLVAYVRRLLDHDEERAREVVQEAWLRLLKERDKVPGKKVLEDRPAPWLFKVCRNLALDVRRKEQRMTPLSETTTQQARAGAPAPDQALEQKETSTAIIVAMGRLPEQQQEVLRLKFQGGLSYREISDVTGHSISHVGFIIHQGVHALQDLLGRPRLQEQK